MRFYQAKGIPAAGMAEPWGNHLEVQSSVQLLKGQDKGFPDSSAGKESARNAGDLGLIPGLGRSLGDGKGYPLQYSGLENTMNCIVHGIAKSRTQLRNFHSLIQNRGVEALQGNAVDFDLLVS